MLDQFMAGYGAVNIIGVIAYYHIIICDGNGGKEMARMSCHGTKGTGPPRKNGQILQAG